MVQTDRAVSPVRSRGRAPHVNHVERVVLSTTLDPFLSLRALERYSGLSRRRLRQLIDAAPDQALPCYRIGGKILVRRSDFDTYMEQYRRRGRPSLARAIAALGLQTPP